MNMEPFEKLGKILNESKKIVIFPHENVDGDAMGTASALCLGFRQQGIESFICIDEAIPANLDFLESGCCTSDQEVVDSHTTALMVDCSSVSRIGNRKAAFLRAGTKLCIDHHGTREHDTEFDFLHVEANSAACAELAFLLLKAMGITLNQQIAERIFTGLTTDTGNFQYSNTTARSHRIAAEIHQVPGFDSKKISSLLYERNSFPAMKLSAMVVENARFECDGKMVYSCVTMKMLEETGALMNETDGIVQRLMSIKGVETAIIFKEHSENFVKVSMRAKSCVNVAEVAKKMGGGGHIRAAGCSIKDGLEKAVQAVTSAMKEQMKTDMEESQR